MAIVCAVSVIHVSIDLLPFDDAPGRMSAMSLPQGEVSVSIAAGASALEGAVFQREAIPHDLSKTLGDLPGPFLGRGLNHDPNQRLRA